MKSLFWTMYTFLSILSTLSDRFKKVAILEHRAHSIKNDFSQRSSPKCLLQAVKIKVSFQGAVAILHHYAGRFILMKPFCHYQFSKRKGKYFNTFNHSCSKKFSNGATLLKSANMTPNLLE